MNADAVLSGLGLTAAVGVWSVSIFQIARHWPGFRLTRKTTSRIHGAHVLMAAAVWLLVQGVGAAAGDDTRQLLLVLGLRNSLLCLLVPLTLATVGRLPLHEIGIHGSRWRSSVAYGVVQLLAWGPATFALNLWLQWLLDQTPTNPIYDYLRTIEGWRNWVLVAFAAVVAAPAAEELLFRGVLQRWLARRFGPVAGIGLSALVFGAAHATSWPDPLPLVLLGIGLGISFQATRSLWAPIAFHAGFNGSMLLLVALGVE